MSRKTATIFISILILLLVGGLLAFYFYSNRGQGNDIITTDPRDNIFPDTPGGNNIGGNQGGNQNSNNNRPGTTPTTVAPVLKELSKRPAAGAVAIATSSERTPIRFVEKGTGHVYEVSPADNNETRITNTTIPKIQEAIWNNLGNKINVRYTDENGDLIKTYSAGVVEKNLEKSEGSLSGAYLTDNIRAITKNPDQNKIFYLVATQEGSIGVVSDFDGTKRNQIFESLLQEWLVDWPSINTVAMTSKPSASVPGYLFLLNTNSGVVTPAISGVNGLTTKVSNDGNQVLYSQSKESAPELKIYNFTSGLTTEAPVTTLPDKCVWSKNDKEIAYCAVPSLITPGVYPDSWYAGITQFSDDIWKINSKNGTGELLARLKNISGQDIDGTNLFLSTKEDYLLFTNKKDSHIWSLKLIKR